MQKLIVKNFGPIREIELDVQDFMVLIGPSGSGKSTIAKLLAYFAQFREVAYDVIAATNADTSERAFIIHFLELMDKRFRKAFGSPSVMPDDLHIRYIYQENIEIEVNKKPDSRGQLSYQLSFARRGKLWMNRTFELVQSTFGIDDNGSLASRRALNQAYLAIDNHISSLFGTQSVQFTVAGRAMLSSLPPLIQGQLLQDIDDESALDPFNQGYINRRGKLIENLSKNGRDDYFARNLELDVLFNDIIGGVYRVERDGTERIYLPNGSRIRLNFASSGQQEATGLLLDLFRGINGESPTFMILEEPEGHLFPTAQATLMRAIALAFNTKPGNRTFITTHSPYILTSLNNLIYAWQVGQESPDEVREHIPEACWLDPKRVGAYYLDNGRIESIMDTQAEMIGVNELDEVSGTIMDEFDALLQIRRVARKHAAQP